MNAMAPPAPSMQPEDYRTLLKSVCILNWSALAMALLLELLIRWGGQGLWPHWGYFGQVYHLMMLEFGVITLGLTVLLRSTEWLDRAPRTALARLRWLLLCLLVLDALHFVVFFQVTGGVSGPVAVYVPLALVLVYLSLPCAEAHLVNAALLTMLALLGVAHALGLVADQGLLAPAFAQPDSLPSIAMAMAAVLGAVVIGAVASRRMDAAGIRLHRGASYDPVTGLFNRKVLERRIPGELARIGRVESSATLLFIEFKNLADLIPHADYAGFSDVLMRFSAVLRTVTRSKGDTCAQYDHSTFAVLLPTANADAARVIAERIQRGADAIRAPGQLAGQVQLAMGAAVAEHVQHADAGAFLLAAKEALRQARNADSGHTLVLLPV